MWVWLLIVAVELVALLASAAAVFNQNTQKKVRKMSAKYQTLSFGGSLFFSVSLSSFFLPISSPQTPPFSPILALRAI